MFLLTSSMVFVQHGHQSTSQTSTESFESSQIASKNDAGPCLLSRNMLPHLSFKPTSMESSIPVPHRELYEHTIASTAFWICAAVFFLLCPVLMTKPGITALCVERIRQRRWNVTVENARDWHQEATSQLEER